MSSKFGRIRPRSHVFSYVFDRLRFILAGNDDIHKNFNEFEIRRDRTMDMELAALERLKKNPTYNGENDITFSLLFFI